MLNDEESWRKGFEIEIMGTVRGCEAAVPFLEGSGAGAIVVAGTTAAVEVVGPRSTIQRRQGSTDLTSNRSPQTWRPGTFGRTSSLRARSISKAGYGM
jgi:NAD(P)-dependent dehydrogenase (short-subunit alcohol dehydrogenase family)